MLPPLHIIATRIVYSKWRGIGRFAHPPSLYWLLETTPLDARVLGLSMLFGYASPRVWAVGLFSLFVVCIWRVGSVLALTSALGRLPAGSCMGIGVHSPGAPQTLMLISG